MGSLQDFSALFQALIAFCAAFTALGFLFNVLLSPVKENQAKTEKEFDNIKREFDNIKKEFGTIRKEFGTVKEDLSIIKRAVLKSEV